LFVASTSRDHFIELTAPGMVTITGGKWTTYRHMAEDTVDTVLKQNEIEKKQNEQSKYIIDTKNLHPCPTMVRKLESFEKFT
jgi:glycerol-3-phosphate dehydrogenase